MALKGLLIRRPYVDWILDGLKTWEIRGSATKVRGPIALIASKSGTVIGTCEISGVEGPLSASMLRKNARKLNASASDLTGPLYYGDHTYAWTLTNAKRLKKPVPYEHPSGAVIWVNLDAAIRRRIGV